MKFLGQALVAQVDQALTRFTSKQRDDALRFDATKRARMETPQSRSNAASASSGPLPPLSRSNATSASSKPAPPQSRGNAAFASSRLPLAFALPPPAPTRPPPLPPPSPPQSAHDSSGFPPRPTQSEEYNFIEETQVAEQDGWSDATPARCDDIYQEENIQQRITTRSHEHGYVTEDCGPQRPINDLVNPSEEDC